MGTNSPCSIRKYREKSGLTQKDIASLMGYRSDSVVCRIDSGQSVPNLSVAIALAHILDVQITDLFSRRIADISDEVRRNAAAYLSTFELSDAMSDVVVRRRYRRVQELASNQ